MRHLTMLVVCMLALAICAGSAFAVTTPPADTLKVDYFANANTPGAPDGTARLDNPGTAATCRTASVFLLGIGAPIQEVVEMARWVA